MRINLAWRKNKLRRIPYLDLLKFIAMSFVCFMHVIQRWGPKDFTATIGFAILYSLSLSVFFFVGGFFVKRPENLKDLGLYLVKLILTYLAPAYLFVVISVFTLPQYQSKDFGYWMNVLYRGTDAFYWYFLVAVFINAALAISFYLSRRVFKKAILSHDFLRSVMAALLLLAYSSVFIYIYNAPDLGPRVLASGQVLLYLPIAFVGFLFATFKRYFAKGETFSYFRISLIGASLIIYVVSLCLFPDWLSSLSGTFWQITLHMLGGLGGAIALYFLAMGLCRFATVRKVAALGVYSGPYYLVHVYFIRLINSYVERPSTMDPSSVFFLVSFLIVFYLGSLMMTIGLVEFPFTDILLFADYRRIVLIPKEKPAKKRKGIA